MNKNDTTPSRSIRHKLINLGPQTATMPEILGAKIESIPEFLNAATQCSPPGTAFMIVENPAPQAHNSHGAITLLRKQNVEIMRGVTVSNEIETLHESRHSSALRELPNTSSAPSGFCRLHRPEVVNATTCHRVRV